MPNLALTTLPPVPPLRGRAGRSVRRVLIVDDSKLQRRILAACLRRLGFQTVEAGSGREALDHHLLEDVDLVLSDWMMPDMDGLELCREVRRRQGDRYVYFILLTSKSGKDEIAQGLDVGADDFLAKPVGVQELRARISAGARILAMERALTERNRVANAALSKLRLLYDAIDRDLIEARKLQQSLVRERRRCFAEGEVNLMLHPSGHVGGDLVGFYRIGHAGVGLYGIDVSGHGIASALLTARLAGYLSGGVPGQNIALRHDTGGRIVARPPAEVAADLNRLMLEEVETEHYFTMALAVLDFASGAVSLVQAGHPMPLVQAPDGAVRTVGDGGLPIGLLPEARYEAAHFTLRPGERLLICSDGFTECPDAEGRMLDDAGLIDMVRGAGDLRGSAFLDTLLWTLSAHVGDRDFPDDLSALLFEYSGPERL
ncbi:PP2C family protein-serine/threonine phosphatase [Frigidibacter sp. ROC022]|uniref:PP2C family protein-serine/threonine phosphatase n=1 Tax=Frigidibacter sp. ROC022 TaxID=2971796 RepID=UPI00215A690E|nr:SpoIIE family protein phosphatase [Frigidibacter sp. ROC022]MCR8724454.1 SpoIIE family protein phosphatase [Frigidibacter sp. ROC022]